MIPEWHKRRLEKIKRYSLLLDRTQLNLMNLTWEPNRNTRKDLFVCFVIVFPLIYVNWFWSLCGKINMQKYLERPIKQKRMRRDHQLLKYNINNCYKTMWHGCTDGQTVQWNRPGSKETNWSAHTNLVYDKNDILNRRVKNWRLVSSVGISLLSKGSIGSIPHTLTPK